MSVQKLGRNRTTYRKKTPRSPSLKYNKLLVQKTPFRCTILPSGTNSAHVCMRIFSCRRAVILVLIRVSADLPFPSRATRSVYSPARRTGGHAHGTRTGTAGFPCSPHGRSLRAHAAGDYGCDTVSGYLHRCGRRRTTGHDGVCRVGGLGSSAGTYSAASGPTRQPERGPHDSSTRTNLR